MFLRATIFPTDFRKASGVPIRYYYCTTATAQTPRRGYIITNRALIELLCDAYNWFPRGRVYLYIIIFCRLRGGP